MTQKAELDTAGGGLAAGGRLGGAVLRAVQTGTNRSDPMRAVEYSDKLGEDDQVKSRVQPGFRSQLRLSCRDPELRPPNVGEAVDFPEFPHPQLPAPKGRKTSKGVLETIDMDSYRVEAKAAPKMAMDDTDATRRSGCRPVVEAAGEADIDKLSAIIRPLRRPLRQHRGRTRTKIPQVIAEDIPARWRDKAVPGELRQASSVEHDKALNRGAGAAVRTTPSCSGSSATTPTSSTG